MNHTFYPPVQSAFKIAVIGLGYVGLPLARLFSKNILPSDLMSTRGGLKNSTAVLTVAVKFQQKRLKARWSTDH